MFLHIGENEIVFIRDIVAIIDMEKTTTNAITRDFLKMSEELGITVTVGKDIPKSFIITSCREKQAVYLSPISTATLLKRANKLNRTNRRI